MPRARPTSGSRPVGRCLVGRRGVVGQDQRDPTVDPADQPLGGELRDVAPDGDRRGAQRLGQVGDAQRAVALQGLQQLLAAGDLKRSSGALRRGGDGTVLGHGRPPGAASCGERSCGVRTASPAGSNSVTSVASRIS